MRTTGSRFACRPAIRRFCRSTSATTARPTSDFARAEITKISVDGGNGDDLVRIDESNGVFTDTIPTTIDGGNGDDNLVGGAGAVTLRAATGTTSWPEAPERRRWWAATATTRSTATAATTWR